MPVKRPPRDHYAVLGVPRSASAREITVAYRRLVRALHPDTAPRERPDTAPRDPAVPDDLAAVLAAYDTLRDPGRRAAYDAARRAPAPGATGGRPVPVRVRRTASARPAPQVFDDPDALLRLMLRWLRRADRWGV
ncbi:J domain-containing protein [Streptomyces sp. JB150]|uniref:J domain-containing protein n=1 Tax=Streptomyces sp. JB150 TaxID=2714844 RepID=UPI001408CC7C|nr:J domain-containing protein [Streptomyces sp. JB150]QIJ61273.1 J domain-containing protein [Streptomyces sp. JB150]